MKIRSLKLTNVRSFLQTQELELKSNISIVVGPNGGGKTNLLETLSYVLREKLMSPFHGYFSQPEGKFSVAHPMSNNIPLEKNFKGLQTDQTLCVVMESTESDIENIRLMKKDLQKWMTKHNVNYYSPTNDIHWANDNIKPGDRFNLEIINGNVVNFPEGDFGVYLRYFYVDRVLRNYEQKNALQVPFISLPVSRSSGDFQSVVTLSQINIVEMRQSTFGMNTPTTGPRGFVPLAIAQLSETLRNLELQHGDNAFKVLSMDSNIQGFTKALRSIGYEWNLVCVNSIMNSYTLELSKQGLSFKLANASSGERELITFLLAIYILNVRDAFIIVDEPELHLHPRWQRSLYTLFEEMAKDTGNQFLLATHSPSFITPITAQHVSRIYSESQCSRIVALDASQLPNVKHQFDAINSQNNERVFFADLVVLVEGPSDRMLFEKLLSIDANASGQGGAIIEVISVGGKNMFDNYASILDAWNVRHVRIADLDYLQQVGNSTTKKIFNVNAKRIKESVQDPTSRDGEYIVSMIDSSIAAGKWVGDAHKWSQIKERRTKLPTEISETDLCEIIKNCEELQKENIFILKQGSLEAYLPDGHGTKDIDRLIELINSDELEEKLRIKSEELFEIITAIDKIRRDISSAGNENIH